MGSMMKADSERRELVRERRQARIERKQERRDARERKRSQIDAPPLPLSAMQLAAQEQVDAAVDRIVNEALERHDQVNVAPGGIAHGRRSAGCPPAGGPGTTGRRLIQPGRRQRCGRDGSPDRRGGCEPAAAAARE